MSRPAEGVIPEFERRTVAAAVHIEYEAFCDLPTHEQAAHIAWHRAQGWAESLAAWDRTTGKK